MGALARLWGDIGHKVNILITGVLAVKPAQFSLIRTELTEVECIIAHTEMISIKARIKIVQDYISEIKTNKLDIDSKEADR